MANAWPFPIENRLNMLSTGIKTPVGIKIMGPDLKVLGDLAEAGEPGVRYFLPGGVVLLVRPENIRLLPGGSVCGINTVEGTVRDSIVLGGAVKHHITLRSGAEVVMQESNHVARTALRRGQPVQLGWSAQDSVVLPPEGASS